MNPKNELSAPSGGVDGSTKARVVARQTTLPLECVEGERASGDTLEDAPSSRALEVLRARDAADARYETVEDPRIPADQRFFKIGEVAEITGIKPYVLRYWEAEFPWLKPEKTRSRQRRYRRQDVALALEISRLRYEGRLTIEGTRQVLRDRHAKPPKARALSSEDRAHRADATVQGRHGRKEIRPGQLARALADMRKTVLELFEAVEE